MKKTGVLLINLGTPDSPKVKDVRRYLTEFLNDPRVIDINPVGRFFLVNGIIVPFRAPKSAKIYKELWDLWKGESPLLTFGKVLKDELQKKFQGNNVKVELAMRYQNPSLNEVLGRMEREHYEEIIIFPLFPHYASASTGSAVEKALRLIKEWQAVPGIKVIPQFYNEPGFLDTIVEQSKAFDFDDYDHIIFSYHGIPERQLEKQHPELTCADCDCPNKYNPDHPLCYRNTCYETSRLLADKLNLKEDDYTSCFQSRLGKTPWLKPYSDKVIEDLVKSGKKRILAFSPAFVADCLETSIEIGDEYQEIVEEFGGEKIDLVPSLNDSNKWISTAEKLIREQMT